MESKLPPHCLIAKPVAHAAADVSARLLVLVPPTLLLLEPSAAAADTENKSNDLTTVAAFTLCLEEQTPCSGFSGAFYD